MRRRATGGSGSTYCGPACNGVLASRCFPCPCIKPPSAFPSPPLPSPQLNYVTWSPNSKVIAFTLRSAGELGGGGEGGGPTHRQGACPIKQAKVEGRATRQQRLPAPHACRTCLPHMPAARACLLVAVAAVMFQPSSTERQPSVTGRPHFICPAQGATPTRRACRWSCGLLTWQRGRPAVSWSTASTRPSRSESVVAWWHRRAWGWCWQSWRQVQQAGGCVT